jgi:hypothetical protein
MSSEIEYITSAEDAEENAAEKMRAMGFTDAQVTGPGADGGIDVWSRKAVAQVKWRSAQTGRPELQQLYGARAGDHDQRLLFFTASGYSQAAIEYAKSVKMALFTYDPLGELTPCNKRARKLLAAPISADESFASAQAVEPFEVTFASKSSAPSSSGGGGCFETVGSLIALSLIVNFLTMLFSPESETEFIIAITLLVIVVALGITYVLVRRRLMAQGREAMEQRREVLRLESENSDD